MSLLLRLMLEGIGFGTPSHHWIHPSGSLPSLLYCPVSSIPCPCSVFSTPPHLLPEYYFFQWQSPDIDRKTFLPPLGVHYSVYCWGFLYSCSSHHQWNAPSAGSRIGLLMKENKMNNICIYWLDTLNTLCYLLSQKGNFKRR